MRNEWLKKEASNLRGAWTDQRVVSTTAGSGGTFGGTQFGGSPFGAAGSLVSAADHVEVGNGVRALVAENVRVRPRRIVSRDGFLSVFASAAQVTSMYNWFTSAFNRLIYFETGGAVKSRDLATAATATLFTQASARGACVSESGNRAFISTYTSAGLGAGDCRVFLPLIGGEPSDRCFAPPWTYSPTINDVGEGNVTAGVHRFGYIVETRSGFAGRPSPAPGDIFTPVLFTVASGGRRLTMTMTVNTPTDAAFIHPIMTKANAEAASPYYFVPDAQIAVPAGAVGWPISLTIDISDFSLASDSERVESAYWDALTQSTTGTAPFYPSVVFPYGLRQGYVVDNGVYFSEIGDYQRVTEALHRIQVPGQKRITTGAPIRSECYLFGPSWTYSVHDNGDQPRTWGQPSEVSGGIGTRAIGGVEYKTGGDYLWVASERGLEFFDGQYQQQPITWLNAEWRRINPAAWNVVQVVDCFVEQVVYVAVPLDDATEPSHLIAVDYSRGKTYATADVTIDLYKDSTLFSTIAKVQDVTTGRTRLWIGPSTAGNVARQDPEAQDVDGKPTDDGVAVHARYRTPDLLPEAQIAKWNRICEVGIAAEGTGELGGTVFGANDKSSAVIDAVTLEQLPEQPISQRLRLLTSNASVEVTTTGRMALETVTLWYKPEMRGR